MCCLFQINESFGGGITSLHPLSFMFWFIVVQLFGVLKFLDQGCNWFIFLSLIPSYLVKECHLLIIVLWLDPWSYFLNSWRLFFFKSWLFKSHRNRVLALESWSEFSIWWLENWILWRAENCLLIFAILSHGGLHVCHIIWGSISNSLFLCHCEFRCLSHLLLHWQITSF